MGPPCWRVKLGMRGWGRRGLRSFFEARLFLSARDPIVPRRDCSSVQADDRLSCILLYFRLRKSSSVLRTAHGVNRFIPDADRMMRSPSGEQ